AVSAEEGVQVSAESFDGLTEIPPMQTGVANLASSGGGGVAYRDIQAEPPAQPGWEAGGTTERMEAGVRAGGVDPLSLTETLASLRAVVRYEIQNAPTKEFRLKVPAGARNVDISGANIRRKDEKDGEWRVELQNKVRGTYTLTATWKMPVDTKAGS